MCVCLCVFGCVFAKVAAVAMHIARAARLSGVLLLWLPEQCHNIGTVDFLRPFWNAAFCATDSLAWRSAQCVGQLRSDQAWFAGVSGYCCHRHHADCTQIVHRSRSFDSDPGCILCCADAVHCAAFVRASVLAMGHDITAYVAWR